MRNDLRQVELGGEGLIEQKPDLLLGIPVRVRPATQRQRRHPLAQPLAKLVGVIDTARRPNRPISTQNRQRVEPAGSGPRRVHVAVLERVLAGEEGDDA